MPCSPNLQWDSEAAEESAMGQRQRLGSGVGALVLLLALGLSTVAAENEPTDTQLFLKGAKLWGAYCGLCHNARAGSEFNRL